MVLKKQTVWLLTMLSLVAVLGVYFFTPDGPAEHETALVSDDEESLEEFEGDLWEQFLEENPESAEVVEEWDEEDGVEEEGSEDVPAQENGEEEPPSEEDPPSDEQASDETEVSAEATDSSDWFSALRIQREENRSETRENYTDVLASSDATTEEKNEAQDERERLQTIADLEHTLEQKIQSQGYSDVIVMSEEDEVRILVEAEELSRTEVVEINRLASEELGEQPVSVGYHHGENEAEAND
ncbi:SpoIIIAH-like family protein [Natribacillus halophilus]|uniref:Stage III sporulation protein AH n=1 Tax=Natribacillus halophilus TaxID=549003 RepID=A0A1G8JKZ5_9BACI|nr:SpoIIIAH-like family protein [Natribacillus halophilus]SDI31687.1 stage III sporulation protein AH [Natribacillus halophilus]